MYLLLFCIRTANDPFSPYRIDEGYIKNHSNIRLFRDKNDNSSSSEIGLWLEKTIPEKYHRDKVYALLGLDGRGFSLKTGEYVTWPN
jgi:hypothetical protein